MRHWCQRDEGECLVACCKIVLDYLGIQKDEAWLWRRLAAGSVTPFPNLAKLSTALGVVVEIQTGESPETFAPYLESGLPVIAAVDADDPRYWPYTHHHAVVVVGFDAQQVFVHDPAQAEAPLAIDRDTFLLVWSRRDFQYAVIRLSAER
jgi:ABC-type bacteriocin/lantibiotic exporter with double-glycine peptidase domain